MKHFILAVALLAGGGALASGLDQAGPNKDERRSMRMIQTVPIVFPQTMLERGITAGDARIAISVDNTGHLTDLLVVGYSHEPFADAAERAMRQWAFEPMRVLNEFVATQAILRVDFEAKGVVVQIDAGTDLTAHMMSFVRTREYAPCPLARLDSIPAPVVFVEPTYPKWVADHGVRGRTEIEFYIDENGAVRVPAVLNADFWELGVLAMDAVRQWRFAPPTSNGRHVLVRVRQAFVFGSSEN